MYEKEEKEAVRVVSRSHSNKMCVCVMLSKNFGLVSKMEQQGWDTRSGLSLRHITVAGWRGTGLHGWCVTVLFPPIDFLESYVVFESMHTV